MPRTRTRSSARAQGLAMLGILAVLAVFLVAGCGGPSSGGGAPASQAPAAGTAQGTPAVSAQGTLAGGATQGAPAPGGPAAAAPGQPAPGGGAPAVIRMGYIPVDAFMGFILAAEKYAREEGLDIRLVSIPDGAKILTQVATGDLQVGGGALGAAALNALAEGLPVKIVAPQHGTWPEDNFMISKKALDAGTLKGPQDLKGKPVAVNARGVSTEYLLDRALRRAGLTINEIDLKTMPFPDMVTALDNGAILACTCVEPFATIAEQKGIGVRPYATPSTPPPDITVTMFNRRWAEENPDAARRFMVAHLKAVRDLQVKKMWNDPAVLPIRSKYVQAPPDVLPKVRPLYIDPNLAFNVPSLEEQQQFSRERGYLKYQQNLDIARLLDTSFVDDALQKLGRVETGR